MDKQDDQDLEAQKQIRELRKRGSQLNEQGKDIVFRMARSFNGWKNTPVTEIQLREIYDLMKMCPTSANVCPIRIKFLRTEKAKKILEPILFEPNRAKTMKAPVVAILGNDHEFFKYNSFFAPHRPDAILKRMDDSPQLIGPWSILNGTLQAAYFILAVRAVGLDAGPMQGLDKAVADETFWKGTEIKTNFICSVGEGEEGTVFKKLPRFSFEEVCEVL